MPASQPWLALWEKAAIHWLFLDFSIEYAAFRGPPAVLERQKNMVKIRLSRAGAKKRPFYHVVATDSRKARDGRFIERLGYYNPKATGDEKQLVIDRSRVAYWQGTGAQVSDRVTFLLAHVASTTDTTKAAEAAPAA
jgi:small subunit ribosomal protein S16